MKSIINEFQTLSLEEIGKVALLKRHDSKYVVTEQKLGDILTQLKPHYRILSIKGQNLFTYKNIYFDTEAKQFYFQHHRNKANRIKIRSRRYVESDLNFLEVKLKNNKKKTIKTRITTSNFVDTPNEQLQQFLADNNVKIPNPIASSVVVNFNRITLVDNDFKERLTIDFNFKFGIGQADKTFENLAVIELKQDSLNKKSVASAILAQNKIPAVSFSKYCYVITQCYPNIKKNLFKAKFKAVEKQINNDAA